MEIKLPEKLYYNIGEISKAFNVNPSLLRFWEKEFDILNPKKTIKGTRKYNSVDIKNLKLIGAYGSDQMSGVAFRKRLGLNSNFVRFKFFEEELNNDFPINKGLIVFGQGSGHGVGMSQWGAKYLASRGQKAERILKHFYKGVQVKPFRKDYL